MKHQKATYKNIKLQFWTMKNNDQLYEIKTLKIQICQCAQLDFHHTNSMPLC